MKHTALLLLLSLLLFGTGSIKAQRADNQSVSLTFAFADGKDGQTATYNNGAEAWFKNNYTALGSNVYYKGTSLNQSLINPSISNEGSANADNAVTFYVIPKKGITFTPTKVSFKTTRYGTNGGKTDVVWQNSDGTTVEIEKGVVSARNNDVTSYSHDISGAKASNGLCGLRLHLYALLDSKQVGYGDVTIEGVVNGEVQQVQQYQFSVTTDNQSAGKVTVTPNATVFDEGDAVTLAASENFGYHFAAWVDAQSGQTVSTANPYTFNIAANTSLKATYTQKNTYALNLSYTEGVNDNLVQVQPEGKIINGVHWYEDGDDVKLMALNNRIATFTNWSGDAQGTDAELNIKMTGTKQVQANFAMADYIVGWDLYYDQPNKDRAADYKADSENAGMLSLRQANGTTSTWLTRGITNGQENGKYAARIWKKLSEEWYFEISFSSKGYENLKISSCLGDDYNTYSVNNVEYSIDGQNFTKIGTFNPPARGWDGPKEFSLPAEANNQERVYIRWMPDRTSSKIGVESDNDGTAVAEIFVLADAVGAASEEAKLVSTTPVEGSTDASANGSIILTFDNKIKTGKGSATLDGEQLQPIVSGKTAVFKYNGLEYGKQYTFSMPEGVLLSRGGKPVAAATINFTTMERQQPEARLFDAIVAQDGTGDYTSVQAAIDAAPAGRAKPWLIFIKNGQYKEHVDVPKTKPYLHFIGQERDHVVIKDDRLSGGDNAVHVSVGATVVVNANNTFFENLTMENIWGHEKQAGPQALALNTVGDRIALNNVALLSYQDTWITTSTSNNRHYIKNSLIEGAVDFIYNSGNVYLDGDTLEINRPSGGYIVAPSHSADVQWGYVFQNNVIRPGKVMKDGKPTGETMNVTDIWLGRPWHNEPKTVFINTQSFVNIPAKGWYNTMGGLPALWAEYNTTDAKGQPMDLSQRETYYYYWKDDAKTQKAEKFGVKNTLTAEEAAQYTLKNVVGGTDGWQPDRMCEACDAPQPRLEDGKLTWQAVPYAICYVVTCDGVVTNFTTETAVNYEAGKVRQYKVQAVNEFGGLSQAGAVADPTGIKAIDNGQLIIDNSAVYYTLDGKRLSQPVRGLNLVRMSNGSVRKMLY